MKKTIITIGILAVAAAGFRSDKGENVTYTKPCIISSIDSLPEGLSIQLREVGDWKPLKIFPKKNGDTIWVYRIKR